MIEAQYRNALSSQFPAQHNKLAVGAYPVLRATGHNDDHAGGSSLVRRVNDAQQSILFTGENNGVLIHVGVPRSDD